MARRCSNQWMLQQMSMLESWIGVGRTDRPEANMPLSPLTPSALRSDVYFLETTSVFSLATHSAAPGGDFQGYPLVGYSWILDSYRLFAFMFLSRCLCSFYFPGGWKPNTRDGSILDADHRKLMRTKCRPNKRE